MIQAPVASQEAIAIPRSVGTMKLATKAHAGGSAIDRFRTSGSTKVVFPRRLDAVEGIMLNTSGGLTGGDRFEASAHVGSSSRLVLTTQAAERAYRSLSGTARVRTRLSVAQDGVLNWLPQELIVFDGAALDRRLDAEIAEGGEAVLVEPVVFGRRAMGEVSLVGSIRDRIGLWRDGRPLYRDHIHLGGSISHELARPAVARGHTAFATALYVGPRAEALLPRIRSLLPALGGASLPAPDLLCLRLLAEDAFDLRRSLVPLLEILTNDVLPKSWSL